MTKERITISVKYVACPTFERPSFRRGVYSETVYVHTFEDADGNTFVWKTSSPLNMKVTEGSEELFRPVTVDSVLTICGTVKGHGEYKGVPQIELSRVVVKSVSVWGLSPEEIQKEKEDMIKAIAKEQRESLKDGDQIMTVDYKRYKDHYADCEVIKGSYRRTPLGTSYVDIIVREGRLVPSGVRGKRFHNWDLHRGGETVNYTAVDYEHAVKRANKELGEGWE